jgi:hypothetical protein
MWLLNFLPGWFFSATFLLGLAGLVLSFFLKFLPFFGQYVLPIRIVFTVILVGSTWMLGGVANEEKWLARVAELEKKIAESEVKSEQANVQIVTKIVTKEKVIKEKADAVVQYIDREVVKYDTKCEIPKEFVKAVNDAAGESK